MLMKAAYLNYSSTLADIPVRFDIFRKNTKLFDWYIKRYNPFIVQETDILGIKSYKITLPFTYEEQAPKSDKINFLMDKTLNSLIDLDISYILPPKKCIYPIRDTINVSNKNNVFPFFMMNAIKKSLALIKKDIKTAEILIIDGNSKLTEILIDNIYSNINFLTVMTKDSDMFKDVAEEIFDDNGLLIQFVEDNKAALKNADIIINTSDEELRLDHSFKKNAVYFDLSENEEKLNNLAVRRNDMLVINNLRLKAGNDFMDLNMFELIFYCLSSDYRFMVNRRYSLQTCNYILSDLNRIGVFVNAFCFNDTMLRTNINSYRS